MMIEFLYHFAPRSRRERILREGLCIFSDPAIQKIPFGYLCFGVTPSAAFGLSIRTLSEEDRTEDWDLFQVRITRDDHLRVEMGDGGVIYEVRVFNTIPPDRIFWCGLREVYAPTHPLNSASTP